MFRIEYPHQRREETLEDADIEDFIGNAFNVVVVRTLIRYVGDNHWNNPVDSTDKQSFHEDASLPVCFSKVFFKGAQLPQHN